MALKRLNLRELEEKCTEVFYDYMTSANQIAFFEGNWIETGDRTPTDIWRDEQEALMKDVGTRIELFEDATEYGYFKEENLKKKVDEELERLRDLQGILKRNSWKTQKEQSTMGDTNVARSVVLLPLNKYINSFYDDLTLEVLFYNDVYTLGGKWEEYKALATKKDKIKFYKENTEITHMSLVILRGTSEIATLCFKGQLTDNKEAFENQTELLEAKFADFENLTLKGTAEIKNNDLRQLLQSKIDLDKEKMVLKASHSVRGEGEGSEYKIYENKTNEGSEYFIRYVCPSTGRVYYNKLILRNLKLSKYFKENDFDSYIDAWWSITHMGAPVEGKAVVSC